MGYRIRLGRIPKEMKETCKGLNVDDLQKHCTKDDSYYWGLNGYEELYEVGKNVGFEEHRIPFFDFDTFEVSEAEFDILSKEGLKAIIDWYHTQTHEYFDEVHADLKAGNLEKALEYFYSMEREWKPNEWRVKPYYLDQEKTDGEIVRSWKIQYCVFNIIHIYRTFDWENDYLIYSGW